MLSITDFRHCIIQPSQLLICQFLVQCPIISFQDLGSAILLSGILLNYTSITKESAPEILMVLRRSFDYLLSTGNHSIESWIQFPSLPIAWSIFDITSSDQHSPSVLSSLLSITDVVLKDYPKEAIVDIVFRLHQLFPSSTHHSILKEFPTLWDKYSKSSVTPIRSLSWREPKRVTEVMLTPAFEVDYKMKSSIQGTNPEKLKLKVLNKQLKREQKASMRELRRDSEFLDQEYFAERSKSLYENKLERVRNYSWLQQEQATFNQQVRKNSKDALKGGGSGSAKKSRKV